MYSAPTVHIQCTCTAHALHMHCTCTARTLHMYAHACACACACACTCALPASSSSNGSTRRRPSAQEPVREQQNKATPGPAGLNNSAAGRNHLGTRASGRAPEDAVRAAGWGRRLLASRWYATQDSNPGLADPRPTHTFEPRLGQVGMCQALAPPCSPRVPSSWEQTNAKTQSVGR